MRNNRPDLYGILHIAPTATAREVTRAYRTLMRGLHPDTRAAREPPTGPGPTEPETKTQEELQELRDIMAAYAILGNPEKRAAYDREHPRPAANAKPQRPDAASVRIPGQLLPAASLLIGPVIWEPPSGRSLRSPGRQLHIPSRYALILRIRR
ncbi:J domain-containing protein [Arthrobacter bambusae]|uniref:J domain-containing protein n=1 Tax=Arthrobacter bambusae TaxID=1338426 RepID=UPI002786B7EE|nr:J domain-containing protein [Arthrobacter bambusae]MDQ0239940.1 curved DNA-binding protein CbpA [Arthrobacter bambusae]